MRLVLWKGTCSEVLICLIELKSKILNGEESIIAVAKERRNKVHDVPLGIHFCLISRPSKGKLECQKCWFENLFLLFCQ